MVPWGNGISLNCSIRTPQRRLAMWIWQMSVSCGCFWELWKAGGVSFCETWILRGEWNVTIIHLLSPGEYSPLGSSNTEFDLYVCKYWRKWQPFTGSLCICLRGEKNVTSALRSLLLWTSKFISPCMWACGRNARAAYQTRNWIFVRFKNWNVHPCWSARYKWRDSNGELRVSVRLEWFQRQLLQYEIPLWLHGTLPIGWNLAETNNMEISWTKLIDAETPPP